MEENIKSFIEKNETIKQYLKYPKEELEVIRMYINLELIEIEQNKDKEAKVRTVKSCLIGNYNYLDYMVSFRCKVCANTVLTEDTLERMKKLNLCECCNCKNCIKRTTSTFIEEIDKYNENSKIKLKHIDVIDYILNRKVPKLENVVKQDFFKKVNLIDLMYVQIILEADLITLTKYNEKESIAEFNYLDISKKDNNEYYINILLNYYKNRKKSSKLTLNIENQEDIFNEKDKFLRVYKIAGYYKYLMECKKEDILVKLREWLNTENIIDGIKVRAQYFIYKYFQKVEQLPYSKKTKDKIYSILNYILNYRYKEGETPYICINILIYSNDKEGVEAISKIIGEFMWFFGYLSNNMRYYDEYMNNIILDKFLIKKLYIDKDRRKNGSTLIKNII